MKLEKIPPLFLALLLQFAPLCKVIFSSPAVARAPLAIVLQWVAGIAVVWGGHHAVSGATTNAVYITSSTNSIGTNGVSYLYRILQSSLKTDPGHSFTAAPLPPGLTVSTIDANGVNVPAEGRITGTPTSNGVWVVLLSAYFTNSTGGVIAAVPTNLFLTIGNPTVITKQPTNATALVGGSTNFSVTVTGSPAPAFLWRKNGTNIAGATNITLNFNNVSTNDTGGYSVIASNIVNSVTSQVAQLTVVRVPAFSSVQKTNSQVALRFLQDTGATYQVQFSPKVPTNSWQTLTNLPPQPQATNITVTDSITNKPARFYQLRMTIP